MSARTRSVAVAVSAMSGTSGSTARKRAIDLFADAVESYWRAAAIGKEKGRDSTRARLEHAENALQRALARQSLRYESSMIDRLDFRPARARRTPQNTIASSLTHVLL